MNSFYFYDLETSGFNPKEARILQFAGQRTDMDLQPVGEPDNYLIKLSEDILPDPDAVLVNGITPQQTIAEGITEAEFLNFFAKDISKANTIFIGFNSIRFDDEFMRYLQYRNFYDPYEWQWYDGRSRWDLLDVVRMTRALRPEGINWPVDSEGKAVNNLVSLTNINKLDHTNAHDALSDVLATIDMARLIKSKQPKLSDFLLSLRTKAKVSELALNGQPFVYTSGKYSSEFEKTTVVASIGKHPKKEAVLVYDLRKDPKEYLKMTVDQLVEAWSWKDSKTPPTLPVKTMQFNRCPAAAPLSVLDLASIKRLSLDMKLVMNNLLALGKDSSFIDRLYQALEKMDKKQQARLFSDEKQVDGQLYDGFFEDYDRKLLVKVREAKPDDLDKLGTDLHDERLRNLLPLYKARNFPASLSAEELSNWERFRNDRLFAGDEQSRLAKYMTRIEVLRALPATTQRQHNLLTDLELYGQSLMPTY